MVVAAVAVGQTADCVGPFGAIDLRATQVLVLHTALT